jgi:hypothetical protein
MTTTASLFSQVNDKNTAATEAFNKTVVDIMSLPVEPPPAAAPPVQSAEELELAQLLETINGKPAQSTPPVAAQPAPTQPPIPTAEPEHIKALSVLAATVESLQRRLEASMPATTPQPAPAPVGPKTIDVAALLANPYQVLKAAGIDPSALAPAVRMTQPDVPPELATDQRFLDLQDQLAQAVGQIDEFKQNQAYERAVVARDALIAESVTQVPKELTTVSLAAKRDPSALKTAITEHVDYYARQGKYVSPQEAMVALETQWAKFAVLVAPEVVAQPESVIPVAAAKQAQPPQLVRMPWADAVDSKRKQNADSGTSALLAALKASINR